MTIRQQLEQFHIEHHLNQKSHIKERDKDIKNIHHCIQDQIKYQRHLN